MSGEDAVDGSHQRFDALGCEQETGFAVANELGLSSVWINRLGETYPTKPTRELPSLERLPEVLDELVAP